MSEENKTMKAIALGYIDYKNQKRVKPKKATTKMSKAGDEE